MDTDIVLLTQAFAILGNAIKDYGVNFFYGCIVISCGLIINGVFRR